MKMYAIYLSDFPCEPIRGRFNGEADAYEAVQRLYIRDTLDAVILKIEELPA